MAFAVFRSSYPLTIDEKNRLLIPAAIRKAMTAEVDGDGFYIKYGLNGRPWLYAKRYYDMLALQKPGEMSPGEELQDADQYNYALVDELDWDKQGRVVVPDDLLKWAGLKKDVSLIGVNNHLELWDRADWEKRREELLARRNEIALKERQTRQVPIGG